MQLNQTASKDWRFLNRVHLITDEVFKMDKIHIDLSTLNPDINTNDKLRTHLFKEWMQTLPRLLNLKQLYLSHKVNDIFFEKICEVRQLENLELKWTSVNDISAIHNLKYLTNLHIGDSSKIVDISPLRELKKLESLSLVYLSKLVDFAPLRNVQKIRSLIIKGDIYHFKDQLIQSLSFLRDLKELKLLDLTCTKVLDDSYDVLLQLKKLETFSISSRLPKELREKIKTLPNLTSGTFVEYDWDNQRWYSDDPRKKNAS